MVGKLYVDKSPDGWTVAPDFVWATDTRDIYGGLLGKFRLVQSVTCISGYLKTRGTIKGKLFVQQTTPSVNWYTKGIMNDEVRRDA